ncbi:MULTISPECIES: type VI secretion system baseplate subunit TssE [unclassified Variovorax]|uniref:type VI secretion system baseplate subunit TssE n=1 Tax=unclassified Variovorax TaxID=663243 RepID=UPI001BD367A9|nr:MULTISPECIES: type VI secretion system baseplate subunit TssE [unclassified Variovorax]
MTGFEPGLLDKLFDDDRRGAASPALRNFSLEEMKNVVARDLESLLNTRMVFTDPMLQGLEQCKKSILTYGLNDFSGRSLASFNDRSFICRSLEQAIARHEPRLTNVVVTLELDGQSNTSVLYFSISALLTLPAMSEPVNFDALLQPTTLQYSVTRGASKARNY